MQLKYVDTKEEIIAINRKSKHIEPHLHNALEIVCVTSGALELGVGQELYHMEKGDIGFVFPDVIHHYQILTPGVNKATYLIASPFTIAKFADIMQSMAPEYPIITTTSPIREILRFAIQYTSREILRTIQGQHHTMELRSYPKYITIRPLCVPSGGGEATLEKNILFWRKIILCFQRGVQSV